MASWNYDGTTSGAVSSTVDPNLRQRLSDVITTQDELIRPARGINLLKGKLTGKRNRSVSVSSEAPRVFKDYKNYMESHDKTLFAQVEGITGKIKPVFLLSMLSKFAEATSHTERAQLAVILLEVYGIYWQPLSDVTTMAVELFAAAAPHLLKMKDNASTNIKTFGDKIKNSRLFKRTPAEQSEATAMETALQDTNDDDDVIHIDPEAVEMAYIGMSGMTHQAADQEPQDLKTLFKTFLQTVGVSAPQDIGSTLLPVLSATMPLIYLGLNAMELRLPKRTIAKTMDAISKNVKNSSTIAGAMSSVHDTTSKVLKNIFNTDRENLLSNCMRECREFVTELDAYEIDLRTRQADLLREGGKFLEMQERQKNIFRMYDILVSAREQVASLAPMIVNLNNRMTRIKIEYNRIKTACSRRQEPVCVWLWGKPGAGKSVFTKHLIDQLSLLEGKTLSVYTRNSEEQYMSGYCGQDVFVVDDFGSSVNAFDITEFIPIKSSSAYSVNMAAIEEKGTFFRSRYIILCSNMAGIMHADKLTNPEAVDRRRDFLINVSDRDAEEMKSAGRFDDLEAHYKRDFSHLTLLRFCETKHNGSYDMWTHSYPQYTPKRLAREIYAKQHLYLHNYETEVANVVTEQEEEEEEELPPPTAAQLAVLRAQVPNAAREARDITRQGIRPQQPPRAQQPRINNRQRRAQNDAVDVDFGQWEHQAKGKRKEFPVVVTGGRKSFMVIGAPGLGKTHSIQEILATQTDKSRFVFIDEFTSSEQKTEEAMNAVWNAYDGTDDKVVIIACNPSTIRGEKIGTRDKIALQRRCITFNFSLNTTGTIATTMKRARNFDAHVKITRTEETDSGHNYQVSNRTSMQAEIAAGGLIRTQVFNDCYTIPQWTDELPENAMVCKVKKDELKHFGFMKFISIYVNKQYEMIKSDDFNMKTFIDLLMQYKGIVCEYEACIRQANVKKVPYAGESVLMIGDDWSVVITSEAEVAVVYEVPMELVEGIPEQIEHYKAHERSAKIGNVSILMEILDGLFYFSKLALATGLLAAQFHRTHKRMHRPLGHEGYADWANNELKGPSWDDQIGEYPEEFYEEIRVPKSAREGRRVIEYCIECHSANCRHCIKYESWTPRIKKAPVEKQNVPLQMSPEGVHAKHSFADYMKSGVYSTPKSSVGSKNSGNTIITSPNGLKNAHIPQELPRYPLPNRNIAKDLATLNEVPVYVNANQLTDNCIDMKPESMSDPGATEVARLICRNTVFIGAKADGPRLRGVMLYNHIGVTNAHGLAHQAVGSSFDVFRGDCEYTARLLKCDGYTDLAFFELPATAPQFKDITRHIPMRKRVAARDSQFAWLYVVYPDMTGQITTVVLEDRVEMYISSEKKLGIRYKGHLSGVSYGPINSMKGYCGSAVIVTNTSIQEKFIAIHSAANNTEGFGALLFRDEVDAFKEMQNQAIEVSDEITLLPHQEIIPIQPMMYKRYLVVGVAGNLESGEIHHQHQITKTKLWDSPLALEEHVMEPTILSMYDERLPEPFDPYMDAVMKYDRDYPDLDLKLLDFVVDEIADYYATTIRNNGIMCRVLSKTEAINGVSWITASNPMQRDSSSGYPWRHIYPGSRKIDFLEFDEDRLIWVIKPGEMGKSVHHAVDGLINEARSGRRTFCPNIGLLKDEPRKLAKIYDAPATRAFWAAPIDKTIADRMYFHTACAALAQTHVVHPMKIGINPQGLGFQQLYDYHSRVSCVGFDLDAKNWDSSVHPEIIKRISRIFNRIYQLCDPNWKEEHDTIRTTLGSYVDGALVLIRDFVMKLPGGNNSGQANTGQYNSFANHIVLFYIWCQMCVDDNKPYWMSLHEMHKMVVASFYGDDLMMTVALRARHFFTPTRYIEYGAKLGITFTPADKVSTTVEWKPLAQMEFLKRKFTRAEMPNGEFSRFYGGALEEQSFHHMLDLGLTNSNHIYAHDMGTVKYDVCAIESTVDTALIEASIHGRAYFDKMRNHLMTCCAEYQIKIQHWLSYTACFNLVWGTDLPDGYQPVSTKEFVHESITMPSQPAVVGTNSPAETTHNGEAREDGTLSRAQQSAEGNTGVITPATGDTGMLPMELYNKNIALGTFVWSSTQNAGTVIFSAPVTPASANAYVQYFSAPFNAWAGGMDYSVLISGTGFNGGKLLVVKIPPNISIDQVNTLSDYTIFDYKIIDVKEASSVATIAYDERNVLFHWRNTDPTAIDSTGGTFVLSVLSPLVSSNGTPCQVNLVIFNKPSPSFRVSQLMPLSTTQELPTNLLNMQGMFPGPDVTVDNPYIDQPVTEMVVTPASAMPVVTMNLYGAVLGDGTPRGRPYVAWKWRPLVVFDQTQPAQATGPNMSIAGDTSGLDASRPMEVTSHTNSVTEGAGTVPNIGLMIANCSSNAVVSSNWRTVNTTSNVTLYQTAIGNTTSTTYESLSTNGFAPQTAITALNMVAGVAEFTVVADPLDATGFTVLNNESVVMFRSPVLNFNSTNNVDCCQTTAIINTLSNNAAVLQPGQAMLWQVFDVDTSLPVAYIKFNYGGVITTNTTTSILVAPYADFFFRILNIMEATSPIPANAAQTQNAMLVLARKAGMTKQKLDARVRQLVHEELGIVNSARERSNLRNILPDRPSSRLSTRSVHD